MFFSSSHGILTLCRNGWYAAVMLRPFFFFFCELWKNTQPVTFADSQWMCRQVTMLGKEAVRKLSPFPGCGRDANRDKLLQDHKEFQAFQYLGQVVLHPRSCPSPHFEASSPSKRHVVAHAQHGPQVSPPAAAEAAHGTLGNAFQPVPRQGSSPHQDFWDTVMGGRP